MFAEKEKTIEMGRNMIRKLTNLLLSSPHKIEMMIYRKMKTRLARGKYQLTYVIPPNSALEYHIIQFGVLNDWIVSNLSRLIQKESVVFDVGANVGLVSLPFAKEHVPYGKVYAFEPEEESRKLLKENIVNNNIKNITVFPYALQDNNLKRNMTFNVRATVDGDGLINKGLSTLENIKIHNIKYVTVPVSTIDKIVDKFRIKRLDFIKIDVEGSEYKVLQGATKSIKNFMPIIQYEYSSVIDNLAKSTNSVNCFIYLNKLGYSQYEIVKEKKFRLIKKPGKILGSNILCFPKRKIPPLIKENEEI